MVQKAKMKRDKSKERRQKRIKIEQKTFFLLLTGDDDGGVGSLLVLLEGQVELEDIAGVLGVVVVLAKEVCKHGVLE